MEFYINLSDEPFNSEEEDLRIQLNKPSKQGEKRTESDQIIRANHEQQTGINAPKSQMQLELKESKLADALGRVKVEHTSNDTHEIVVSNATNSNKSNLICDALHESTGNRCENKGRVLQHSRSPEIDSGNNRSQSDKDKLLFINDKNINQDSNAVILATKNKSNDNPQYILNLPSTSISTIRKSLTLNYIEEEKRKGEPKNDNIDRQNMDLANRMNGSLTPFEAKRETLFTKGLSPEEAKFLQPKIRTAEEFLNIDEEVWSKDLFQSSSETKNQIFASCPNEKVTLDFCRGIIHSWILRAKSSIKYKKPNKVNNQNKLIQKQTSELLNNAPTQDELDSIHGCIDASMVPILKDHNIFDVNQFLNAKSEILGKNYNDCIMKLEGKSQVEGSSQSKPKSLSPMVLNQKYSSQAKTMGKFLERNYVRTSDETNTNSRDQTIKANSSSNNSHPQPMKLDAPSLQTQATNTEEKRNMKQNNKDTLHEHVIKLKVEEKKQDDNNVKHSMVHRDTNSTSSTTFKVFSKAKQEDREESKKKISSVTELHSTTPLLSEKKQNNKDTFSIHQSTVTSDFMTSTASSKVLKEVNAKATKNMSRSIKSEVTPTLQEKNVGKITEAVSKTAATVKSEKEEEEGMTFGFLNMQTKGTSTGLHSATPLLSENKQNNKDTFSIHQGTVTSDFMTSTASSKVLKEANAKATKNMSRSIKSEVIPTLQEKNVGKITEAVSKTATTVKSEKEEEEGMTFGFLNMQTKGTSTGLHSATPLLSEKKQNNKDTFSIHQGTVTSDFMTSTASSKVLKEANAKATKNMSRSIKSEVIPTLQEKNVGKITEAVSKTATTVKSEKEEEEGMTFGFLNIQTKGSSIESVHLETSSNKSPIQNKKQENMSCNNRIYSSAPQMRLVSPLFGLQAKVSNLYTPSVSQEVGAKATKILRRSERIRATPSLPTRKKQRKDTTPERTRITEFEKKKEKGMNVGHGKKQEKISSPYNNGPSIHSSMQEDANYNNAVVPSKPTMSPYSPFFGLQAQMADKNQQYKLKTSSSYWGKGKNQQKEKNQQKVKNQKKKKLSMVTKSDEKLGYAKKVTAYNTSEKLVESCLSDVLLSGNTFFGFHEGNKKFEKMIGEKLLLLDKGATTSSVANMVYTNITSQGSLFLVRSDYNHGWKVLEKDKCLVRIQEFMAKYS